MSNSQIEYEAVYLFSSLNVVAQFTFSQFEKLVDMREPKEQLQGRTINAALLQLDGQLSLRTLVLFTVPFDDSGKVDSDWDIPLRHLAQMASKGPDLGQGRINISCRSQCSVDWYKQDLWEPDSSQTQVFFNHLLQTVEQNKLKFEKLEKQEIEVLLHSLDDALVLDEDISTIKNNAKKYNDNKKKSLQQNNIPTISNIPVLDAPTLTVTAEFDETSDKLKKQILINHEKSQLKFNEMLKEQKLKHDIVVQHKNEELEQVKRVMRNEMQADKQLIKNLQRKINQLEVHNESEDHLLLEKDEQLEDLQFKFEQQTERLAALKDEHLALLKTHNHHKHTQSPDEEINELNDEINTLHSQLEGALNREDLLVKEIQSLKASQIKNEDAPLTKNELIDKMIAQELVFTAYHAGAGHLSIPARNVTNYLKNPNMFAAQKCAMKLKDYEIWLKHFETPICEQCSIQINRVNAPNDFVFAKHAYCKEHC
ncbi:hypothetical protein [Marinicellulosiphila megalodicopiae]|uniref:hypothetical protein n=1 Tax=Marinicellulosiphila megalodicopiae TaxID=2724896 RepID=UPI003BB15FFC